MYSEISWLIIGVSGAIFCAGFYFEFLRLRRVTLLDYEQYRRERLPHGQVLRLAGYDPFEIARNVALRAGVPSPELFIVSEQWVSAEIAKMSGGITIVCGAPFFLSLSEREFEGVVGHEIGHLFAVRWHSHVKCFSVGFFAAAAFLLIAALIFRDTPILLSVEFLSLLFGILSVVCSKVVPFFQQKSEYAADRKALSFTRYPWDFVGLLSKTEGNEPLHRNTSATAGIFSLETQTHPPAWKRALLARRILEKQGIKK